MYWDYVDDAAHMPDQAKPGQARPGQAMLSRRQLRLSGNAFTVYVYVYTK